MLFKDWEGPESEVCHKALETLGVLRTSTSQNGEFSLGPIMQGPLEISAFLQGHSSETVRLLVSEEYIGRIFEVSEIRLQPVATLIAWLDSSEMDRRGPLQVILDRHDLLEFEVNKQWIPAREGRLADDEPLEFTDLHPGNYRMRIVDDEISYKLEVELVPGTSEVTIFPRPVFIEGRVLDGNIGVEDAEVALLDYGTQTSAVTDSEGRYALTSWHLADFGLFVKHPDGPSIADHLDLQDAEFGSTVERDFIFSTAMLEGTVVSKKDGSPIPAAKVSLRIELEEEERGVVRGATTDDDGRFSFDRVEEDPTSAVLVTRKDGFLPKTTEPVLTADETTTVWIELEEGQDIQGVVHGPSAEPVAGARVVCCFDSLTGRPLQAASTDAEGRFELSAAPGSVVFASARGYGLGWAAASDADTIITLAALHGGARLRLVSPGGQAIVGARVLATDSGGTTIPSDALSMSLLMNGLPTASGEEGVLSLPVLPAGTYHVGLLDRGGTQGGGRILVPSDVVQDVVVD